MSTINSIGTTDPIQQVVNNPVQKSTPPNTSDSVGPSNTADRLELSGVNSVYQALQANNIRTDLVSSVRSQIEAGTYETDQKLNSAVDKLLDDLNS
jgi:anti-sigma28 factor (negative regulator of flagellin synthesis)